MRTERRHWGRVVALAAVAFTLTACQEKDVGQPCSPRIGGTSGQLAACTDPAQDVADYFESSSTMPCDNLICVHSAKEGCTNGALNGKCSKACVSDDDCFKDETGMVCRQVILSDAFIEILRKSNPALLQQYLQDLQTSYYCALPTR